MKATTATFLVGLCTLVVPTTAQTFTEDFEGTFPGAWVTSGAPHSTSTAAAHAGTFGVRGSGGWIYNTTATVQEGDILSVWTRADATSARTYLGFDAGPSGCKSFVFSSNTQDIRFQDNPGYGYTELTTTPTTISRSVWYYMEVELMPGGVAEGRLYDASGTTLVSTVTHTYGSFTFGGVALRAGFGSGHDCDDVNLTPSASPSCSINVPVSAAIVMGDTLFDFDVDDPQMDPLAITFEFSTDAGVTWLPMTPAAGSPLGNPEIGVPSPTAGLQFIWDTVADGLGFISTALVDTRISLNDGMLTNSCTVDVEVDNVAPLPTCTITEPSAMISGTTAFDVQALSISSPTVDTTIDFSIDGGTTWSIATAAPTSALPNPATGIVIGPSIFEWDSRADGVGTAGLQPGVLLRMHVDDGVSFVPGECFTNPLDVDNADPCGGLCGDCNLNGLGPDVVDALTAAQIDVGLLVPTFAQTICCDVNMSGSIEVLDALFVAQLAASLPVTLTCF